MRKLNLHSVSTSQTVTDEILLRDEFSGDSWKLEVKVLVTKLNFFVTVLLMDEEKVLRPFD